MREKLKQVENQLSSLENILLKKEMEKVYKIKHPVYYLLTIFILFNCAGSPPEPIPEPVPEVVKRTTAIAPNPPKSILIQLY